MEPLAGSTFSAIIAGSAAFDVAAPELTVRHLTTHSKRIQSDSAFFAIDGEHSDGHAFAAEALDNGAAVVVTRAGAASRELAQSGRVIEVDDPLTALQRLAAWWRRQIMGKVVAVVGSNGKTITKDALAHLLGDTHDVYASPGSYNSKLGVPLAILGCPGDCEVAIVELAVTAPGEMAVLEQIVRPDHVILTNVGARWRSQFDGDAHQARELLRSAVNLKPDGWLLMSENAEETAAAAQSPGRGRKVLRGDLSLVPAFFEPQYVGDGFLVEIRFPDERSERVNVLSPSTEILDDVELATGAAWLLGAGSESILGRLEDYRPTSTRMEIWRAPTGVALIRDVATPDPIAVGSAVRAAKRVAGAGRTVVVLAEDIEPVDSANVGELAQIFATEEVAGVYALDGELPAALRVATQDLEQPVPVHLLATRQELRASLLEDLGVGDVALVQAPRGAGIGDLSAELIESMAPTRLYLDASAIEENVSAFRRLVGSSVQILGVVKALAYGTGGVDVASCFEASGVDCLGVSTADEGIALRRSGITLPILVLLGMVGDVEMMLRNRLTPVVYSEQMLAAVLAASQRLEGIFAVHVEVDTGMHRLGFSPERAAAVLAELADSEHVRVAGIMTHYACADDPSQDAFTMQQTAVYEEVLGVARGLGLGEVTRHAAATSATLRFPETHFDMVRIGLGLHGVHPSEATREKAELAIAFGLVSRIAQILDLPAGEKIGYGSTYTVPTGGARVGVVPAGYNDGVAHALSNRGEVIVAGARCKIRGKVSMDSMTIDLSECPAAQVGSDVLILGRRGDWYVRPEEVAREIASIPYEPMVRVGHRVQRVVTRH